MQCKRADAMTLKSDEIRWWNILESSVLSLIASAMAFSSAITDVAVNWQKNVIQQYTSIYTTHITAQAVKLLEHKLSHLD